MFIKMPWVEATLEKNITLYLAFKMGQILSSRAYKFNHRKITSINLFPNNSTISLTFNVYYVSELINEEKNEANWF